MDIPDFDMVLNHGDLPLLRPVCNLCIKPTSNIIQPSKSSSTETIRQEVHGQATLLWPHGQGGSFQPAECLQNVRQRVLSLIFTCAAGKARTPAPLFSNFAHPKIFGTFFFQTCRPWDAHFWLDHLLETRDKNATLPRFDLVIFSYSSLHVLHAHNIS